MRVSVAIFGGVTILLVGFFAMNEAANQAYDPAVVNGTNESAAVYNTSVSIFDALGQAAGPGVVWAGAAAFVLVALGLLVAVYAGGGR